MAKAVLTIKDLKKYLAKTETGPDQFARDVKLSHMTIRRWLKRPDQETLPSKYLSILGPILGKTSAPELPKLSLTFALKNLSLDSLMNEIEAAGVGFKEIKQLENAVLEKLKRGATDKTVESCCLQLLKTAKSSKAKLKARATATGALLFFVNPIGVPDESPLTGYLGVVAVLSMALNRH